MNNTDLIERLHERHNHFYKNSSTGSCMTEAADALEAAQQAGEPVAKLNVNGVSEWLPPTWGGKRLPGTLLYTHPAPQVPMTDAQQKLMLSRLFARCDGMDGDTWDILIIEAVEAHHGIKHD